MRFILWASLCPMSAWSSPVEPGVPAGRWEPAPCAGSTHVGFSSMCPHHFSESTQTDQQKEWCSVLCNPVTVLSNCGPGEDSWGPFDSKEVQPVHPKGNQPWVFIERTDAEAESLILWPPDPKNWLIGKDPDAGNDWGQEEKGTTEDEMAGWHHWLAGHKFG